MNHAFEFGGVSRVRLAWLLVAAFGWRLFISALTPIPAEDGVNYLWMAERFAELRVDLAFGEVFPPMLSLLTAPWIALGLDPFRAGQLVGCAAGVVALWAGVRVCERFVPGSSGIAVWVGLFAPLPTRFAGEVYSEPVFIMFGAMCLHRLFVRERLFEAGLWCGFAFWVRDEAVALGAVVALTRWRQSWKFALGALIPVGLLVAWRYVETGILTISPKAAFSLARIDRELGGRDILGQALKLPWLWLEAYAVTGVAAAVGMVRAWRRRDLRPLVILVLVGGVLICVFVARRRFWISWFFAVLPLAVVGLRAVAPRVRDVGIIILLISNILLSLRIQAHDRIAERQVGEYLARTAEPRDRIVGDMTRVLYFAGRRPLPPRRFSVAEIVAAAREPGVEWVVLGNKRDTTGPIVAELSDLFHVHDLPAKDREIVRRRGILVLRRTH